MIMKNNIDMRKQVLSIEQMQELIDMGIDTSNASMCWIGCSDENDVYPYNSTFKEIFNNHKDTIPKVLIPTFTLQDILEMLPQYINYYKLIISKISCEYYDEDNEGQPWLHLSADSRNIMFCAFEMLKWVKENNYI